MIKVCFFIAVVFISFVLGFNYKLATYPREVVNLECPEPIVNVGCPEPLVNVECPESPECPDCKCAQCYHIEDVYTSHFQQIISTVHNERDYEYDHMNWNCDEMSSELKDRLNNAGYNCKTIVGYYDNGTDITKHQWNICNNLIVEATDGKIVHPNDFWRYN